MPSDLPSENPKPPRTCWCCLQWTLINMIQSTCQPCLSYPDISWMKTQVLTVTHICIATRWNKRMRCSRHSSIQEASALLSGEPEPPKKDSGTYGRNAACCRYRGRRYTGPQPTSHWCPKSKTCRCADGNSMPFETSEYILSYTFLWTCVFTQVLPLRGLPLLASSALGILDEEFVRRCW